MTPFLLLLSLLSLLAPPAIATTTRRHTGVGASSPSYATHFGGQPLQIELLSTLISSSCERKHILFPFLRQHILKLPSGPCATGDEKCFAGEYLLERTCPVCPATSKLGKDGEAICRDDEKIGENVAFDLINKILSQKIASTKEKEAVDMLSTLVANTCANYTNAACAHAYQCAWDPVHDTCQLEPCAFVSVSCCAAVVFVLEH